MGTAWLAAMGVDGEGFCQDRQVGGLRALRPDRAAAVAAAQARALRSPDPSARRVLTAAQRKCLVRLAGAPGIAVLIAPDFFMATLGLGAVAAFELGPRGFMALALGLGGAILLALVHAPWAIFSLAARLMPSVTLAPVWAGLAAVSYLSGIVIGLLAPGRLSGERVMLALTQPLYWPLQTIAMARALNGLASCAHFRAKTPHREAPAFADPPL